MENKKGTVDVIKQRTSGYSIKIGEEWFSGWGTCPYTKGQEVTFEYTIKEKDGVKYMNIIEKEPREYTPTRTFSMDSIPEIYSGTEMSIKLGQAQKQAQLMQLFDGLAKGFTGKDFEFDWSRYGKDVENFFRANKAIEIQVFNKK